MRTPHVTMFVGVLLALSGASVGHAQGVSLDLVGGVNITTLQVEGVEETSIDPNIGPTLGIRLSVGLSPSFGLILGALYSEDVLEWFRSQGPRYQSRMNAVLRAYMLEMR
jgi:hypothetical protein